MVEYNIILTEPAQTDMREIWTYIAYELKDPNAADNLIDELEKGILSLSSMPKRIGLVQDEQLAAKGIRDLLVENYVIFFKISKPRIVTIQRVLYVRRDWQSIL